MAIQVANNFKLNMNRPLDSRLTFDTIVDMSSYPEPRLYNGIISYNNETKKFYTYDENNVYTDLLHKWKELTTGAEESTDSSKFEFTISNFTSPLEGGTTYAAGENMTVVFLKNNPDIDTIDFYANDIQVGTTQTYLDNTLTYEQEILSPTTVNTVYKAVVTTKDGTEYIKTLTLTFVYPTYYGVINTILLAEADLPTLNQFVQAKHDLVWKTALIDKARFVYSYPDSIGKVAFIKDNNGLDYLVNSISITQNTFNGVPYTTCILNDAVTVADNDYILIFGGEEDIDHENNDKPIENTIINVGKNDGDGLANVQPLIIQKNGLNIATYNTKTSTIANITTPNVTLNGTATEIPNFYAPTIAGTAGYVLTSRGAGQSPVWKNMNQTQNNSTSIAHLQLNWSYTATDVQNLNVGIQNYALANTNQSIVVLGSDMQSGESPRWIEIKTAGTYHVTFSVTLTSVYRNGFKFSIFKDGKNPTMDQFSLAVPYSASAIVDGHDGLQTSGNSPTVTESVSETLTGIFTINATDFTDNNVSSFVIYPAVKVFNTQGFNATGYMDIVKI